MGFNSKIELKDLKLYRCTIISENSKYFIGKDVLNNKFFIKKNQATKHYKIGTNDSFYAKVEQSGFVIKRLILNPISSKEYEGIHKKQGRCFKPRDVELLSKIKNI